MELRISIHSFVDVITNSSTVLFVEAKEGTLKMARALVSGILKATGVQKDVSELFDIYIEKGKCGHEIWGEECPKDIPPKKPKKLLASSLHCYNCKKDFDKKDIIKSNVGDLCPRCRNDGSIISQNELLQERYDSEYMEWGDDKCKKEDVLVIKTKTKGAKNIFPNIKDLFEIYNKDYHESD